MIRGSPRMAKRYPDVRYPDVRYPDVRYPDVYENRPGSLE
jgi:hypothetical protein